MSPRPSSTIDWALTDGVARGYHRRAVLPTKVTHVGACWRMEPRIGCGSRRAASVAANFAFDVTPARLVTS